MVAAVRVEDEESAHNAACGQKQNAQAWISKDPPNIVR